MRILVVNVNTTESMTAGIGEQARRVASPDTEIIALTPHFGAESVEGNLESYLAAIAVMDRVLAYDQPYDAVIQAGYGEHGREGLQELLDVPVVDITDDVRAGRNDVTVRVSSSLNNRLIARGYYEGFGDIALTFSGRDEKHVTRVRAYGLVGPVCVLRCRPGQSLVR